MILDTGVQFDWQMAACNRGILRAGQVSAHDQERSEVAFFVPERLPTPLHQPTLSVLELSQRFRSSGTFQVL